VVKCLPSISKTLELILSTTKKKRRGKISHVFWFLCLFWGGRGGTGLWTQGLVLTTWAMPSALSVSLFFALAGLKWQSFPSLPPKCWDSVAFYKLFFFPYKNHKILWPLMLTTGCVLSLWRERKQSKFSPYIPQFYPWSVLWSLEMGKNIFKKQYT
jgi:hypothetical protein